MLHGQTPFSELFPPVPTDLQEPFWYASLQSLWLYYRVDPELLRTRLPQGSGLEVALFDFGDGDLSGLASIDFQRYTGHLTQFLVTTDEVEVNFYAYPTARQPEVPLMSWEQYLLGSDQTKTIGGYRLHVPCDNPNAVRAGQGLYGEPKYVAVFEYTVPSLNGRPSSDWSYQVFQDKGAPDPYNPPDPHTPVQGALIYSLDCDLGGVSSVPASPSPLIEYGVLDGRLVANFWDFYGPFDTYMPARATITYGTEHDETGTLRDLRQLIGHSQPIAAQVYTSPPASAESRGWYQVPKAPTA
jgi:hypothetical protein